MKVTARRRVQQRRKESKIDKRKRECGDKQGRDKRTTGRRREKRRGRVSYKDRERIMKKVEREGLAVSKRNEKEKYRGRQAKQKDM